MTIVSIWCRGKRFSFAVNDAVVGADGKTRIPKATLDNLRAMAGIMGGELCALV